LAKDTAAHCNAVFLLPIAVASGYFWLCGLHVVLFLFGLLVVAGWSVLAGA
jgi:hypothetical protein